MQTQSAIDDKTTKLNEFSFNFRSRGKEETPNFLCLFVDDLSCKININTAARAMGKELEIGWRELIAVFYSQEARIRHPRSKRVSKCCE